MSGSCGPLPPLLPPLQAWLSVSSGVSTEVNSSDGCACRTCASVAHGAAIVTGRKTPLASEFENSAVAEWFSHASQNR
jgi:hypothetical protein